MLHQNSSARFVLIFCVVILPLVAIHFSHKATATQTALGYCASSVDQSVYITEIFNTGLSLDVAHDSNPIQNEYSEYLKGRFDFKSNASSLTCPVFDSMGQAQSSKRDYEMQMRQGNNKIVELEWNYKPEPGHVRLVPRPGMPRASGPITPQADHTFCISDSYQNTVYFTGPVATPQSVAMYSWINGFTQFLKGKYSFQGRVYCNMGTAEIARRLVNAHLDGARAAGRKVIETDWKYDASQVTNTSSSRPADQDEDRPSAPRPAAQPPNLQARDFAIKEGPRALSHCVSDRLMASAFDCDCLRRQISTYRLNHVSDTLSASPTPLEELFKGDKFECKSCIQVEWKFRMAVRSFARSPGEPQAMADCTIEKFHTLLQAKPYPSQSRELLNEAKSACR